MVVTLLKDLMSEAFIAKLLRGCMHHNKRRVNRVCPRQASCTKTSFMWLHSCCLGVIALWTFKQSAVLKSFLSRNCVIQVPFFQASSGPPVLWHIGSSSKTQEDWAAQKALGSSFFTGLRSRFLAQVVTVIRMKNDFLRRESGLVILEKRTARERVREADPLKERNFYIEYNH